MKTRLHKLEIQNFKAFRDFSLNLDERHILVYVTNRSTKRHYWTLNTSFKSARKTLNLSKILKYSLAFSLVAMPR